MNDLSINPEFESAFKSVFVNSKDYSIYNDDISDELYFIRNIQLNEDIISINPLNVNEYIIKESENKKINFISKKKRGKGCSNKSGKYHLANDNDNIRTKIQVHYLNFIVVFFNDIIYAHFGINNYFYKFDYSQKNKINFTYVNHLIQLTIREIFENLKISRKYKIKSDTCNTNKTKLLLLNKNDIIEHLLNINYLEFFWIYLNDNKTLKEYLKNEKKITLSEKTKSFYYLYQKYIQFKDDFLRIVKMDYLDKIGFGDLIDFGIINENIL